MRTLGLTVKETAVILTGPRRIRDALLILTHIVGTTGGSTCDEAAAALSLPHGSSSPRFSELERAGCLVFSGIKRTTRSGGLARVCQAPKGVNFHTYLTHIARAPSAKAVRTPKESTILDAVYAFLHVWSGGQSKDVKKTALKALVRRLETVALV